MCDVQRAGRDNCVLDVLKAIGTGGFVIDSEAPARDLPYLDPGFATPALRTVHLSAVQTRGTSREEEFHLAIEPVSDRSAGGPRPVIHLRCLAQ